MAKARLIDFRPRINEHISSHMIGDSQGQNAVDVDLGSVRLQGRIKLDNVEKAEGTFYYDTGDTETSRWGSTDSTDGDAYIAHASDFAIWNRDLYVALGGTVADAYHSDGLIVRFLDGASSGANVAINPPASASCTITEPNWDEELIAQIDESGPSGGDAGIVTTVACNHDPTNWTRIYHTYFGNQIYSQSSNSEPAAYGVAGVGRTIWTRNDSSEYVVAVSPNDGVSGSIAGDLMTWSGGSISGSNTNVSTVNADNFKYQADGSINNSRAYSASGTTRQDTSGTTYNEYTSSLLGSGWAQSNSGVLYATSTLTHNAYTNVTVTDSTYTNYYPAYSRHSANTATLDGVTYDYYEGGPSNTDYYIPTSNFTTPGGQSVTDGYFYRITGGGGTTQQTSTVTATWARNVDTAMTSHSSSSSLGNTDSYIIRYSNLNEVTVVLNGNITIRLGEGRGNASSSQVGASTFHNVSPNTYSSSITDVVAINSTGLYQTDNNGIFKDTSGNDMPTSGVSSLTLFRSEQPTGTAYYVEQGSLFDTVTSPIGTFYYYNIKIYSYYYGTITFSDGATYNAWGVSDSSVTINGKTYSFTGSTNTSYTPMPESVSVTLLTFGQSGVTRTEQVAVPYTFTAHTHSQSAAYSFSGTKSDTLYTVTPRNYQLHENTTPSVLSTPATPAFTYDKARNEIYQIVTNASQPPASDSSFSSNWMIQDQSFSGASDGYYLKTVQVDTSQLLQVSNSETKASNTVTSTVFGTDAEHTPLRLDFTINAGTSTTPIAYKLRRLDDRHDVELGYIMPETSTIFTYTASTKTITLGNLNSSATYQLRFHGYQDTLIQVGSASAVKSNVNGVEFSGGNIPSVVLSTSTGGDSAYVAADFWLKKQVSAGTSVAGDETYAVIKCFDIIHKTSDASPVISGECNFLDGFESAMAGSGVGTGDNTATDAPNHLRFLKESNNFFFGVGTSQTAAAKYGGVNKKGTFLFVSAYNDPTNWPLTGYVQFDSEITGLASYPGELIVFTENGVYRVTGSRFDQMRKTRLATTEGLPNGNHKTIAIVNNYLCWLSASGICFYNGATVSNLTRRRFDSLAIFDANNTNIHAGQYEDSYYVVNNSSDGYVVDFSLEGFPVSKVDLKEDVTPLSTQDAVLHYVGSKNRLYTRNGVVEQDSTKDRNLFTFKTRAFDGGAFGSLKYIKNICINGTGSGKIQVYLDGQPAFLDNIFEFDLAGQTYLIKSVPDQYASIGYEFYYEGVLIRSFAGSYQEHTTETGSLTEGNTWTIGAGVAPDANGPAWNVTFGSTLAHTTTHQTSNPTITWTNTYYKVRNNLKLSPSPKDVAISATHGDQPTRVYLPANPSNIYGLPVADVWSVEILEWDGQIDWIDAEYEVVSN